MYSFNIFLAKLINSFHSFKVNKFDNKSNKNVKHFGILIFIQISEKNKLKEINQITKKKENRIILNR